MIKGVDSAWGYKVSWLVSFLLFWLMVCFFWKEGSWGYLAVGGYFFIVAIVHLNIGYRLRLGVWFIKRVTFLRYFLDNLFDSPFMAWFVNYLVLSLLLLISGEGFIVSFIVSLPISVFTIFIFLPIVFLAWVVVFVVESIFKKFVDRDEYDKIIFYYEELQNKKHKREIEDLQRDIKYLQESKSKERANSSLWFLAGLVFGWFLFNE